MMNRGGNQLNFRPRFRVDTSMDGTSVEHRLRQKAKELAGDTYESTCVKGHLVLRIPERRRHFWSPQLDISITEAEGGSGSTIRCLLAPAPVVWTMFMFFYALSGFAATVGLMIGSSQYSLDKNPWGFWLAAGAVILGLALYVIAQFGKMLGSEEMQQLSLFVLEEDWPEPIEHVRTPVGAE